MGLWRRGVDSQGFFYACQEVFAFVEARDAHFIRTLELGADFASQPLQDPGVLEE
jgi:hypothetical protein